MNINLEKLFAEMKDRPWKGGIQSLLANLRSKRLTGNFPIPFVKVKTHKKCGIAQLPREDFPIFGIDPKNDSFDLVHCSKCNTRYRLQNVEKHLVDHTRVVRSQAVESPESSLSSQPNTPTKASKKEIPKITKKFLLSPPEVIIPVDIILSDPDISSSSGDNSYPSDASNLSTNGLVASVKTEIETSVPVHSNLIPVGFATSNSGIQSKSKHVLVDKVKKSNTNNSKDSKKSAAASKIKEYDPNRHCGVCTEENGWSPCLRSLTCKSHTIFLRRSVQGRIKSFDELLLEHKQSKGSKTVPSINLANKLAKKKPVKDPVVLLHPLSAAHVQLTPLPSPVPSPTPQYINSPVTQPASPVQPEPSCVKDEPMLVDETPEQKPELEERISLAPLPVIECTTRVRRSRQPPQPLGISRVSLVIHNNRMFANAREAYWMKLLMQPTSHMKNTININSIKNNLYPAQFFNLMNAEQVQNGVSNFIPINNNRAGFHKL